MNEFIVCVSKKSDGKFGPIYHTNLKLDKVYKIEEANHFDIDISSTHYLIRDESDEKIWCPKKLFINLQEYRDKKLNEIGI